MADQRAHTFFVLKQPGRPDRILVWDTQDISVGRAPENDLTLDDEELSRRHAHFSRQDNTFLVKNLSTSNGTSVNGREIDSHTLKTKDVVQVASAELHFYHVQKNPLTLGAKVEYASQLKEFGGANMPANPESTMLGLMDVDDDGDDDFQVGPARDFEYDLHGMGGKEPQQARNLDLELEDPVLDIEMPSAPKEEAWELDASPAAPQAPAPEPAPAPQPTARPAAAPAPTPAAAAQAAGGSVTLNLEIEGLTPELRQTLVTLLGKVIELPSLRVRIKGADLG